LKRGGCHPPPPSAVLLDDDDVLLNLLLGDCIDCQQQTVTTMSATCSWTNIVSSS
jgi:hypothetical protein